MEYMDGCGRGQVTRKIGKKAGRNRQILGNIKEFISSLREKMGYHHYIP